MVLVVLSTLKLYIYFFAQEIGECALNGALGQDCCFCLVRFNDNDDFTTRHLTFWQNLRGRRSAEGRVELILHNNKDLLLKKYDL